MSVILMTMATQRYRKVPPAVFLEGGLQNTSTHKFHFCDDGSCNTNGNLQTLVILIGGNEPLLRAPVSLAQGSHLKMSPADAILSVSLSTL